MWVGHSLQDCCAGDEVWGDGSKTRTCEAYRCTTLGGRAPRAIPAWHWTPHRWLHPEPCCVVCAAARALRLLPLLQVVMVDSAADGASTWEPGENRRIMVPVSGWRGARRGRAWEALPPSQQRKARTCVPRTRMHMATTRIYFHLLGPVSFHSFNN